jgi:hypothetical protein
LQLDKESKFTRKKEARKFGIRRMKEDVPHETAKQTIKIERFSKFSVCK